MASFNPFATGEVPAAAPAPTAAPAAPAAAPVPPPVPVAEEAGEVTVEGSGKKARKPRDKKNTIITKEQKVQILKRYAEESCAAIGLSMGLEARQVYNVVRNSRIKMEEALKTEVDSNKKAALEAAIARLPHKEFGGGAAGPRANTLTEDDIISSLLG